MRRSLPLVVSMLCASAALAEPPASDDAARAGALIDAQLIAPLKKAEKKRARFSRAMPGATERRVDVQASAAASDARGEAFVPFSVDVRRPWDAPGRWARAELTGCAYLGAGAVYVRSGDHYVPAKHLLGQGGKAPAGVCAARDAAPLASAAQNPPVPARQAAAKL